MLIGLERIKCFVMQSQFYPSPVGLEDSGMLDLKNNHEFFGVGSVLRIIPGVDICTGGELTLVGGMRLTNETIRFTGNYRPLDVFNDNNKYSLYVAFEYSGIVTITPGYCDIAMIRIDSYNQLTRTEITPLIGLIVSMDKGLWDKTKKFFRNARTFIMDNHIPSTLMQYMPFAPIRNLAPIVRMFGYGLEDGADDDDDVEGSSVTR